MSTPPTLIAPAPAPKSAPTPAPELDWAANVEAKLLPFQHVMRDFMTTNPYCGIFVDMGGGKAQPLDSQVLTPTGFVRMGQVHPGMTIVVPDGTTATVSGVFPQGHRPVHRVILGDGRAVRADLDHLWTLVHDPHPGANSTRHLLTTAELLSALSPDAAGSGDWFIEAACVGDLGSWPLQMTPEELAGLLTDPSWEPAAPVSASDEAILGTDPGVSALALHVPVSHRLRLLRALQAGLSTHGRDHLPAPQTQALQTDIDWLCHSLGGVAGQLPATSGNHDQRSSRYLPVVAVEFDGVEPTQCISVDHPLHEYVTDGFVRTHNTMTTLSALSKIQPAGHILIIAPKSVAVNTWVSEIRHWGFPVRTRSLTVTEPGFYKNGRPRPARKLRPEEARQVYEDVLTDPPTLYLINREMLGDLVEYYATRGHRNKTPNYAHWPFWNVIIDESQSFKNAQADRTKALTRVRPYIRRMILLSGTPTPKEVGDLWAQVRLLDQGAALGQTMSEFRQRWFRPARMNHGQVVEWKLAYDEAEADIYRTIEHLAMSSFNDSLNLPGISYHTHLLTLSEEEQEEYRLFREESILEYLPDDADGTSTAVPDEEQVRQVVATNAAALRNKLLQYASGSVYIDLPEDDPGYPLSVEVTSRSSLHIHDHKIIRTRELIEQADGPVMVAYRFVSDAERLEHHLRAAGHQVSRFDGSQVMLAAWNNRQIPVLLLQPASAGHGLNFQFGGRTMIWFNLPDSLEYYLQANARLHRMGQTDDVEIHQLVMAGTFDEVLPVMLDRKEATQRNLLDALYRETIG